jgi:periplasmic protein TonB
MFEKALLEKSGARPAIPLGYIVDAVLVGLIVLYPLVQVQALPELRPPITGLLAAPPPEVAAARRARTALRPPASEPLRAPVVIPKFIAPQPEVAQAAPLPGGVPGGSNTARAGAPWESFGAAVPSLPARPALSRHATRVRVGGQVEAARLIYQVQPQYPDIAKMARVQGTVRLEAVISPAGVIQSLRAVSGPPLLIKAAIDAVSRWRYQPTLLNGEPVEVSTAIEVNFTLNQ